MRPGEPDQLVAKAVVIETGSLRLVHGRVSGSEAGHELVDESPRRRRWLLTEKAQEGFELAEGELDRDQHVAIGGRGRLTVFCWMADWLRGGQETCCCRPRRPLEGRGGCFSP